MVRGGLDGGVVAGLRSWLVAGEETRPAGGGSGRLKEVGCFAEENVAGGVRW